MSQNTHIGAANDRRPVNHKNIKKRRKQHEAVCHLQGVPDHFQRWHDIQDVSVHCQEFLQFRLRTLRLFPFSSSLIKNRRLQQCRNLLLSYVVLYKPRSVRHPARTGIGGNHLSPS